METLRCCHSLPSCYIPRAVTTPAKIITFLALITIAGVGLSYSHLGIPPAACYGMFGAAGAMAVYYDGWIQKRLATFRSPSLLGNNVLPETSHERISLGEIVASKIQVSRVRLAPSLYCDYWTDWHEMTFQLLTNSKIVKPDDSCRELLEVAPHIHLRDCHEDDETFDEFSDPRNRCRPVSVAHALQEGRITITRLKECLKKRRERWYEQLSKQREERKSNPSIGDQPVSAAPAPQQDKTDLEKWEDTVVKQFNDIQAQMWRCFKDEVGSPSYRGSLAPSYLGSLDGKIHHQLEQLRIDNEKLNPFDSEGLITFSRLLIIKLFKNPDAIPKAYGVTTQFSILLDYPGVYRLLILTDDERHPHRLMCFDKYSEVVKQPGMIATFFTDHPDMHEKLEMMVLKYNENPQGDFSQYVKDSDDFRLYGQYIDAFEEVANLALRRFVGPFFATHPNFTKTADKDDMKILIDEHYTENELSELLARISISFVRGLPRNYCFYKAIFAALPPTEAIGWGISNTTCIKNMRKAILNYLQRKRQQETDEISRGELDDEITNIEIGRPITDITISATAALLGRPIHCYRTNFITHRGYKKIATTKDGTPYPQVSFNTTARGTPIYLLLNGQTFTSLTPKHPIKF